MFSQIQVSSVGNISGYIPARGTRQRSRPMQASLEVLEWRCDSSSSKVAEVEVGRPGVQPSLMVDAVGSRGDIKHVHSY